MATNASNAEKQLAIDLHDASKKGDVDRVRLFLEQGADPNNKLYWSKRWKNRPPLHVACEMGKLQIVTLLIATGRADVCRVDNDMEHTPLHWASREGHKDIVVYLVTSAQCNVDARGKFGRTPLHWACHCGVSKDVVQYLAEDAKCDISLTDNIGRTPLHWACLGGNKDVVQYLHAGGCQV